jgi:hypothetical protein
MRAGDISLNSFAVRTSVRTVGYVHVLKVLTVGADSGSQCSHSQFALFASFSIRRFACSHGSHHEGATVGHGVSPPYAPHGVPSGSGGRVFPVGGEAPITIEAAT